MTRRRTLRRLDANRVKIPRAKSHLEETFWLQLKAEGLQDEFTREFRFDPHRKWRFDFANESLMLGVEIEGGIWNQGRHNRGSGFEKDCEKYNHAAVCGWVVMRFTPKMVNNLEAVDMVKLFMQAVG